MERVTTLLRRQHRPLESSCYLRLQHLPNHPAVNAFSSACHVLEMNRKTSLQPFPENRSKARWRKYCTFYLLLTLQPDFALMLSQAIREKHGTGRGHCDNTDKEKAYPHVSRTNGVYTRHVLMRRTIRTTTSLWESRRGKQTADCLRMRCFWRIDIKH